MMMNDPRKNRNLKSFKSICIVFTTFYYWPLVIFFVRMLLCYVLAAQNSQWVREWVCELKRQLFVFVYAEVMKSKSNIFFVRFECEKTQWMGMKNKKQQNQWLPLFTVPSRFHLVTCKYKKSRVKENKILLSNVLKFAHDSNWNAQSNKSWKKSLFVSKWVKGSEQKEQQQKTYYITC